MRTAADGEHVHPAAMDWKGCVMLSPQEIHTRESNLDHDYAQDHVRLQIQTTCSLILKTRSR